jgi:hypothetical protein
MAAKEVWSVGTAEFHTKISDKGDVGVRGLTSSFNSATDRSAGIKLVNLETNKKLFLHQNS